MGPFYTKVSQNTLLKKAQQHYVIFSKFKRKFTQIVIAIFAIQKLHATGKLCWVGGSENLIFSFNMKNRYGISWTWFWRRWPSNPVSCFDIFDGTTSFINGYCLL